MNVQAVERFYDRFAGVYDLLFDQVFRAGRRAAIEAMGLSRGDRALEVGVGTGLNLPFYPAGVRVAGIDLSMPMLVEAHSRHAASSNGCGLGLLRMNAIRLGFADASFDGVCAPYVASVVPDLHETLRALNVNAPFVLLVSTITSRYREQALTAGIQRVCDKPLVHLSIGDLLD